MSNRQAKAAFKRSGGTQSSGGSSYRLLIRISALFGILGTILASTLNFIWCLIFTHHHVAHAVFLLFCASVFTWIICLMAPIFEDAILRIEEERRK